MTKAEIAKKLKSLREQSGMTQAQVGEKVEKAYQTVASWESGQSQPDSDTFMTLCEMYGVTDILFEFGYGGKHSNNSVSTKKPATDEGGGLNAKKLNLIQLILTLNESNVLKLAEFVDSLDGGQSP